MRKKIALALAFAVMLCACARQEPLPAPQEGTSRATQSERSSATESSSVAQIKTPVESSTPPAPKVQPEITLSANHIALGEVLVITAQNAALADSLIKTDLPFQPRFFEDGDQLTALVPVSYALTPGEYSLNITSGELTARYTIAVDDRVFEIQHLTVDPTVTANTAGSADANLEWETKVEPLKSIADPQKYWEGAFLQPVQGQITTEFGMIRYTNGSTVASRHSGIDIAAATGTQVSAPNNGRVIFAEFLQLTGNTVIIEHGLGLKSFFYHMDSLDVKEGDQLKKGDPVGKVGSTGFSTGAHLHYCLAVNNVFVNPWTAFEKGI